MEQSIEAQWLINNWNREVLGFYQRQWIAVSGQEIIAHAETYARVSNLVRQFRDYDPAKANPLFAFVFFGRLQ